MEFIKPLPFTDAIRKLGSQPVIGSTFSSSEWSDVPLELGDNAFFSSRVESARALQRMQDALGDFLAGNTKTAANGEQMLATGSRAAFVSQMQQYLAGEGITRTGGGLTDLTSEKRLGLIFDIKTRQAQDFGNWLQGMNPKILNEFPAMRFIRVRDVKEPRVAHEQYENQVYLKTDPIWWLVINKTFGVPWGPFGFGCGHDVEDVDRDEAESLGLLKPGEKLTPPKQFTNLNRNLQASMKTMPPELVEKLKKEFGDKIVIEGDTMRWRTGQDSQPAAPLPPAAPAVQLPPTVTPPTPAQTGDAPERQNPVSDAIQVKVYGKLRTQMNVALAAIDKVHDDGNLPEIPLKETQRQYFGYLQTRRSPQGWSTEYMAVRESGAWPALTAVHETGHFLDLEAIGTKGGFATTDGHAGMKAVLDAAEQTEAIKGFRERYGRLHDETTAYFLKPEEIWARAYAQFIAERSGSPLLLQQLKAAQDAEKFRQWGTDDFIIIADAIEKMFVNLGWL